MNQDKNTSITEEYKNKKNESSKNTSITEEYKKKKNESR